MRIFRDGVIGIAIEKFGLPLFVETQLFRGLDKRIRSAVRGQRRDVEVRYEADQFEFWSDSLPFYFPFASQMLWARRDFDYRIRLVFLMPVFSERAFDEF